MKVFSIILPVALVCTVLAIFSIAQTPSDAGQLDSVLKKMDAAAATFHSAQADFEWDTYEKVIDEVDDVETGTIYYRKNGNDIEMMAEVKKAGSSANSLKPEPKYVLFNAGKVQMYQPRPDQLTIYDVGKNKADFENYLVVLGFGGSGEDLRKGFDVTYAGPETVSGVKAAKLQLTPKSEKLRNTYKQIILWIDTDKGIAVQQQLFTPDGNYKLVKYSSIQINRKKIPDEVFKIKTTSKTQTISPHS
jgi:outer membrane lipoprotein-sorting protein